MRERFSTQIPVNNDGRSVTTVGINVPRPMTEAEWQFMLKVLRKMKPALVTPDSSGSTSALEGGVR